MRASLLAFTASLAFVAASASTDNVPLSELISRGFVIEADNLNEERSIRQEFPVRLAMRAQQQPFTERSVEPASGEQLNVVLERAPNGDVLFPRSWSEAVEFAKRSPIVGHLKRGGVARHVKRSFSTIITWYSGHDLLGPSCVTHSNWAPTDHSLVAALTIDWAEKPACGSFIKLQPTSGSSRSVIVRAVDSCGGCKANVPHVDLTQSAFETLFPLSVGLTTVTATVVASPVKVWDEAVIAIYGPEVL